MRLAIFLDNLDFEDTGLSIIRVIMFDVNDRVILSIGEEAVSSKNHNYLILLLVTNNVVTVYADNISPRLKEMLQKTGIEHKALEELKENPLFRQFLL